MFVGVFTPNGMPRTFLLKHSLVRNGNEIRLFVDNDGFHRRHLSTTEIIYGHRVYGQREVNSKTVRK